MYCPRCGAEQVSKETRYCSRCGFQLSVVTGLLATDGLLPNAMQPQVPPPQPPLSPRKQGVRQGAKLMFLSLVTLPVMIGLSIVSDWPGFLLLPFTIFLAGLAWMVYSAIFGEDYVSTTLPQAFYPPRVHQQLNAPPRHFQAPSADGQRAAVPPPRRVDTSEIVAPPSVTESTTKLFDKESQ